MSRIGRKPVDIPAGVDVKVEGGSISVKGQNGELNWAFHPNMTVEYDDAARQVVVSRPNDQRQNRALHGLTRSLINNMVIGVVTYFEKRLEIIGVGYNAIIENKVLNLSVGFANTVRLPIPEGVICETTDPTHITVRSADKRAVGQFAANIRHVKPPEPYKGKGIRYLNEQIRRKAGKAFGSGG